MAEDTDAAAHASSASSADLGDLQARHFGSRRYASASAGCTLDACLEALSWLLWCIEAIGTFVGPQASLLVRLLAKPISGFRPIGLYRGLFRIWSRGRVEVMREWQQEHAGDGEVGMAPHRHCGDSVWRSQIRSIVNDGKGLITVEVLEDITKCYEHVVHSTLVSKAIAHSYQLAILRVSVSSYLWPIYIIYDMQLIAQPVMPVRGIIA